MPSVSNRVSDQRPQAASRRGEFRLVTMASIPWTSPECWHHKSDCSILRLTPCVRTTWQLLASADREQNGALRETNRRCCSHCNKTVLQSKHAGRSLTPEVAICHLSTRGAKGLTVRYTDIRYSRIDKSIYDSRNAGQTDYPPTKFSRSTLHTQYCIPPSSSTREGPDHWICDVTSLTLEKK